MQSSRFVTGYREALAVPTQPASHCGYSQTVQGPLSSALPASSHFCVKIIWQLPFSQDEVPGSPEDIEETPPRASVHLKALEGLGRLESAPVSIGKGA